MTVAEEKRRRLIPALGAAFDGDTIDVDEDHERLEGQLGRVEALMSDQEWRTLGAIQTAVGGSEAGISARLRDLRKAKHGGYCVERRRVPGRHGLHEYRINLATDREIP